MSSEVVFRLVSVRQPPRSLTPGRVTEGGRVRLVIDLDQKPDTDFQRQIKTLIASGRAPDARRVAAQAKQDGAVLTTVDGLDPTVVSAIAWVQAQSAKKFDDVNIAQGILSATGKDFVALMASKEVRATMSKLEDSLVVEATLGETNAASPLVIDLLKTLKLLESAAAGQLDAQPSAIVGVFVNASIVVVPAPARGDLGTKVDPPEQVPPQRPRPSLDLDEVRDRFETLMSARDGLAKRLRGANALSLVTTKIVTEDTTRPGQSFDERLRDLNHNYSVLSAAVRERSPEFISLIPKPELQSPGANEATMTAARISISPTALRGLKPELLAAIKGVAGSEELPGPVRTMALLDRELQHLSGQIDLPEMQSAYVHFAGGYIDKTLLTSSVGIGLWKPFLPVPIARCNYAVGVADLLLVRQTLKAYELADFAHVENVLRGELREREHRRLNVTEETTEVETERELERERNLQSTERSEMQAEATKQLKSETGVQAGLTVSGSYGPTVSFTASLNASFSTSVQESQRKATSFSREVTEKTSERVRERVREERRKRMLEQVEELNRHKIDNSVNPTGHIRGIYRWLNKIYDAQVFNYGKRMMYEFVIPEPAAYLIYTLVEHPPADTTLPPKPEPPLNNGTPLKPDNLTRYNYQKYVAQYHITNAPAPPSEFKVVSHFDKLDGQEDPAVFGRAAKLAIPDDYEAYGAYVSRTYVFPKGESHTLSRVVGGNAEAIGSQWGASYLDFNEPFRNELSISYGGYGLRAFSLGVDVFCGLTEEGLSKWQQKAYDAIIEGYQRMRGDYEEKLAASQIAQGVQVLGQNPL